MGLLSKSILFPPGSAAGKTGKRVGKSELTHFYEVKEDEGKRGVCIWKAKMSCSKANAHWTDKNAKSNDRQRNWKWATSPRPGSGGAATPWTGVLTIAPGHTPPPGLLVLVPRISWGGQACTEGACCMSALGHMVYLGRGSTESGGHKRVC